MEPDAFLVKFMEHNPYPTWISDDQGTLIRLNRAYRDLFHIRDRDAVGRYNVFRDEGLAAQGFLPAIKQVFANGKSARFRAEYDTSRFKNLDPKEWVSLVMDVTVVPVFDDRERVTHAIFQHIDITESKWAEEALRRSEKECRSVIENIQDVFYRSDVNGRLIMGSPSGAEMFGYDLIEEVIGRSLESFWADPKERGTFLARMKAAGGVKDFEAVFKKKNGAPFHVSLTAHFYRDERGNLLGMEGIIRDITERKRAEEALRRSEKEAHSLLQETTIMAEIGRIISSTLDIGEVYERFAAEVKKLVPFDRICLVEASPAEKKGTLVYAAGLEVPSRLSGDRFPLAGSVTGHLFATHAGLIVPGKAAKEFAERTPGFRPIYEAGFRSMMAVPLISRDQFVGTLALDSLHPDAYSDHHLKIAIRIANHIAGAVANARLYWERKRGEEELRRSEERARRLAAENEVVAEIGRIITSTIKIEEVYERFAEEARKIIHFDRTTVTIYDLEENRYFILYTAGDEVPGFHKGDGHPIHHESLERAGRVRPGIIFQLSSEREARAEEEVARQIPSFLQFYRNGMRSVMRTPLISKDQAIGSLSFHSRKFEAYTEDDLRVAARIANQIAGAVANAQLFQKQKRTEEELFKSNERYRLLVERSPLMVIVHQQGKYVYLNSAAVKALGASKMVDLANRSIYEVIHPDYWDAVKDRVRRVEEGETVLPLEEKYIRLDKKVIDVEVSHVQILDPDGPMILIMGRDITEQKKAAKEKAVLEAQLQQAQKMEAIGTLAGGIAHDFNNILAGILGYAELVGLDLPEDSKAEYNLRQSIKAAHRAKELVRQILTFSRQGEQERKPLDVRPIIKEALKFLRSSLPATIEIRQEIEKDLGMIEADATQVYQVLMNLCTNAAQAMGDQGGVLEVSLSKADLEQGISGVEPGRYLRLRVSDTGQGMPPDVLKRIFDPYFTTKAVGKGTGLGLSVVHGIVKSYGGGIAVSSEAGQGSAFDIYFPRIQALTPGLAVEKAEPLPLGGHERVLFVDDEETIVEFGQKTLEHLGYEVVARTSSAEALEAFQAAPERFDLVITDMTMPDLTGDKLARKILKIRPGIPIILCTGFNEYMSEQKAKALGIREFVMKPLVMKDLAKAIRKALDSRKKKKGGMKKKGQGGG